MTTYLLNGATATGAGVQAEIPYSEGRRNPQTYQAKVAGTGSVSATVVVEVSNDGAVWDALGTITLSGTTSAHDGFASSAPWTLVRGNVTAISGTSAAVTLTMGV